MGDIDTLIIGKCYKLESSGEYLGELISKQITGSHNGRELTAIFNKNDKISYIPRWSFDGRNQINLFIEVPCMKGGKRRFRATKKARRNRRNRSSRRN